MNLVTKFKNFINTSPIISYGQKLVTKVTTSLKSTVGQLSIFKHLKSLFSPVTPPFKPPTPSMGDVFPPTIWNTSIRKVLSPVGRAYRPSLFTKYVKPEGLPIGISTFGVPPSYLAPTTLAGKQYIPNPDELFRFFKINDVGQITLSSTTTMWQFRFQSDKAFFLYLLEQIASRSGLTKFKNLQFPVKYVLQTDEFTFSFSNSYGDTFLEQFNNILSGTARQLVYLTGRSLTQNLGQLGDFLSQLQNSQNMLLSGLGRMINGVVEAGKELGSYIEGKAPPGMRTFFGQLNRGHKILFPKIWQGSSFSNSYSIRTTLYALSDDEDEVERYVLVPLLILVLLATPKAVDKNSAITSSSQYFYEYPFVFKGEIEGVREIQAGVITDLRISLGGDRSFYNIEKKYLAIDVEFTVMDVYDVMVSTPIIDEKSPVPTTSKWFKYITKYISKTIK